MPLNRKMTDLLFSSFSFPCCFHPVFSRSSFSFPCCFHPVFSRSSFSFPCCFHPVFSRSSFSFPRCFHPVFSRSSFSFPRCFHPVFSRSSFSFPCCFHPVGPSVHHKCFYMQLIIHFKWVIPQIFAYRFITRFCILFIAAVWWDHF
jgi:hypothetical protein